MNFAEAMKEESSHVYTENGAAAKNTSGSKLVDLYATIGALRNADVMRITRLFEDAYNEDPLLATKILFYARDIRGGLGERKVFRILIKDIAKFHPEALRPNLDLIGVYGRYDDLYELIGTSLENDMWKVMKKQLEEDIVNDEKGYAVSLLGKWIKSPDTSSKESRKLGALTAKKMGYKVYDFKRILRKLRKRINIVEALMTAQKWDEIKYPEVPSRAMKIYRKAFYKHDLDRFNEYVQKAVRGEVKINSSTLYPYDIIEAMCGGYSIHPNRENHDVLEAQWRQLPNYVKEGEHAIVMADTSGSMRGRPLSTAIGLAIYFAERNVGPYKDVFLTFSEHPTFHTLKGNTLEQKLVSLDTDGWDMNTNLHAAFNYILETAIKYQMKPEEMPRTLIVISDMEIDAATTRDTWFLKKALGPDGNYHYVDNCGKEITEDLGSWSFYENTKKWYAANGYQIPDVIFWNVDSRHDVFHADSDRAGVQLVSGQSTSIFKQVMNAVGVNAFEAMLKVLNSERYSAITVER